MVHYRHRYFVGPIPAAVFAALVVPPIYVFWGDPLSEWLEALPVMLLVTGGMAAWWWLITIRWMNKEVVVDDDGLWIDGEHQIHPSEIAAVTWLDDPASAFHLRRMDDEAGGFRSASYWYGWRAWLNMSWWRVVELDSVGVVAVRRDRDLARASSLRGILVVSKRSDPEVPGNHRGWILGTYRGMALLEALLTIAPQAVFGEAAPDLEGDAR